MNEIQKLIEIYENLDGLNSQSIRLKLKEVIEELKNYQSKENKWIPVSERLPEFNIEVLVCNDDGKIHVALREDDEFVTEWRYKYYCYDSDIWDVEENGEIIAWMPLPEPYKENEGD